MPRKQKWNVASVLNPTNIGAAYNAGKKIYNSIKQATKATQAMRSRKSTRTRMRRRHHTKTPYKAVRGVYVGGFKRRKRRVRNDYAVKGVIVKSEFSGSSVGDQAIYVGHSTFPAKLMFAQLARVLVKELCNQKGNQVMSFDQTWGYTNSPAEIIRYTYTAEQAGQGLGSDNSPTPIVVSVVVNQANTLEAVAQTLVTSWCGLLDRTINILKIELIEMSGPDPVRIVGRVWTKQFRVAIWNTSVMKFQNATEATPDGVENDDDEDDVNNIRSNPLSYKSYERYGVNGLMYTYQRDYNTGLTVQTNLLPGPSSGSIQLDPTIQAMKGLYHAPNDSAFMPRKKRAKSARGVLNPGEIKADWLNYKKSYTFDKLWRLLMSHLSEQTGGTMSKLLYAGNCRVYAWELTLYNNSDPQVHVTWEHDVILRIKSYYRKSIATEDLAV